MSILRAKDKWINTIPVKPSKHRLETSRTLSTFCSRKLVVPTIWVPNRPQRFQMSENFWAKPLEETKWKTTLRKWSCLESKKWLTSPLDYSRKGYSQKRRIRFLSKSSRYKTDRRVKVTCCQKAACSKAKAPAKHLITGQARGLYLGGLIHCRCHRCWRCSPILRMQQVKVSKTTDVTRSKAKIKIRCKNTECYREAKRAFLRCRHTVKMTSKTRKVKVPISKVRITKIKTKLIKSKMAIR